MSDWKSFTTKPHNGQMVIVMHEREETRYAGVYIEFKKESYLMTLYVVNEIPDEPPLIEIRHRPIRWFTHWKEV